MRKRSIFLHHLRKLDGGLTVLTLRPSILSDRWKEFWAYFLIRPSPDFQTEFRVHIQNS